MNSVSCSALHGRRYFSPPSSLFPHPGVTVELMQGAFWRSELYIWPLCTKDLKVLQRRTSRLTKYLQNNRPHPAGFPAAVASCQHALCHPWLLWLMETYSTQLSRPRECTPNPMPCGGWSCRSHGRESERGGGPMGTHSWAVVTEAAKRPHYIRCRHLFLHRSTERVLLNNSKDLLPK